MTSTYNNDLRLEEMATGENDGTWGGILNTQLSLIADAFSYGSQSIAADADETFTIPNGSANATRSFFLKFTSGVSLTATRTVTLAPNTVSKLWLIENSTTGGQSITISQGSGSTVTVASGATKLIYTDGQGSGASVVDALAALDLASGTTAVTQAQGDNSTAVATTAYVDAAAAAQDTLAEILGNGNSTGGTNLVVTAGDVLTADTINETTSASGVTIDGVLLKDNAVTASSGLTGTIQTAAQPNITSLGALTTLTVDNITVNGAAITSDTGAISFGDDDLSSSGSVSFSGGGSLTGSWDVGGTWTAAATWTLPAFTLGGTVTSNGQSFSGTIADLGTVTTVDINGGTIDGVTIGGAATAAGTFTTVTFANLVGASGANITGFSNDTTLAGASATEGVTENAVKGYVDATVTSIGAVSVSPTPVANDYARFTSGSNLEGRSAAEVRADLDLEVGTDVQAWNAGLDDISGLTPSDGNIIVGDGANWVAEADATARASLGVAIGTDVQAYDANLTGFVGAFTLPTVDGTANQALATNGSGTLSFVDVESTLATQTKTYISGEQSTLTLSSAVTSGVPVVSVTKEVAQTGVTNNNWDVNSTAENYTRVNSAPATTLDFVGFDVSTASFVDSFDVSAQDGAPNGIAFNTDGTKMFIMGDAGQDVNEYTLSTGFDVSTATYSQNFSISAQETTPRGIAFNTDGTKMFIVGIIGDDVNEYTLGTGFDLSTASYSQNFSVSAQETEPTGIAFNTDGTKMFIVGNTGNDVNEYTLGTGFDVSTASYSQNFSVSAQETTPTDIAFNTDGTKMFIVGQDGDDVNEYTLGTGFDVSTATYSQNFSISAQDTSPTGIAFNTDGTKMFIVGNAGDDVNEYNISPTLELGSGSFASGDVGKTIEANDGAFVLTATDGSVVETTAPTSYDQVASGSWEMYAVVYNSTDGDLELSGVVDGAFDVSTASFVDSFSVSAQEIVPLDIAFNTDGTKMFIVGTIGDDVNEYTLGTGFDVSTASYSQNFSVSAQDTNPTGIAFNTDGTKMFIVGTDGQDVNEYDLGTGFDVSTATYSQNFSVSAQETAPSGIAFNTDGTKMFILGDVGDDVNEYTLGTGFDVSTATYSQNFSVASQETQPRGIAFNTDGTKMFVVGGSGADVHEYTLSTGFDISTATYSQNFSVSAQETDPRGIAFNTYGTKMFIVGASGDDVNEYTLGTIAIPSGYHAAHTTTSTDTTYWTDINSMTADQSTGDGNIYYAVSTDDRTTWTVIDNTDGERDIVRNNAGTWEYNSNSTYGSETWTAASTNTELSALEEAMAEAQNRMDKTQLEAVTDANQYTLGNDLDLAIIFNLSSGTTVPSSDGVSINYDANTLNEGAVLGTDYDFDFPATDKVRITALAANNLKVRVV